MRVLIAGAPVKDARVQWFDARSADASVDVLTGGDGTATLPIGAVAPGRGRLEVRLHDAPHDFADATRVRWDATPTSVEFLRLTARAVDVDGSPVPGAFVAWRQPRALESGLQIVAGILETDASGVVTLPPVDAGAETYLVAARTRSAIPTDLEPDRFPPTPRREGRRVGPADAGMTIDVRLVDAPPK